MQKLVKADLMRTSVQIHSETSDKVYTVTMITNPEDPGKAVLHCNCMSWKFNNNPKDPVHGRVCKHIQQFLSTEVHPNTRRHLIKGVYDGLKV